jgi:hypothetical protein
MYIGVLDKSMNVGIIAKKRDSVRACIKLEKSLQKIEKKQDFTTGMGT